LSGKVQEDEAIEMVRAAHGQTSMPGLSQQSEESSLVESSGGEQSIKGFVLNNLRTP
jgi:hypothetical protein